MIDVHIAKSNRPYFDECVESLKNEPINLHIVPYQEYGAMRIEGFMKGTSPFVAAVDDDDIVVEGVFHRALDALNKGYSAYYSNHHIMNGEGTVYGKWFDKLAKPIGFSQLRQMHHVVVYRREIIQPVLKYLSGIKIKDKELLNLKSIYDGTVFGDNFMGLYWRVHDQSIHTTRRREDNPPEWTEQVEWYRHQLLNRVKK